MTVPAYILMILQGYNQLITAESFGKRGNCTTVSFAKKRAWIYMEIFGFVANFVMLVVYLVESYLE